MNRGDGIGIWMTNRSNSVSEGSPLTSTCMRSTAPRGLIVTWPWALGKQVWAPYEGTMPKVNLSSLC